MCTVAQDGPPRDRRDASASSIARCSSRRPLHGGGLGQAAPDPGPRMAGADSESSSEHSTALPEAAGSGGGTPGRWRRCRRCRVAGRGCRAPRRVRDLLAGRSAGRPWAVAAGSRIRLTAGTRAPGRRLWKSTMKLSASSSNGAPGWSRRCRRPAHVQDVHQRERPTASRSELRDRPSSAARSASLGSRCPGAAPRRRSST